MSNVINSAKSALELEYTLSPHARFLKQHGMYSAALFYKNLNETLERRAARAIRYRFEEADVPNYVENQTLFVHNNYNIRDIVKDDDQQGYGCSVSFDGMCLVEEDKFVRLYEFAKTEQEKNIVHSVLSNAKNMYSETGTMRYLHYGTHNVVDFAYILANGFYGYWDKILAELNQATNEETVQFQQAMLDTVDGIINYVERYREHLKQTLSQYKGNPRKLQRLVTALDQVPLKPATNFYEAFITMDAAMFLSDCFEPGRIDALLYPYYERDLTKGLTSKEEAIELIRELFAEIEKVAGHPAATHATVGGTKLDGSADYNELTDVCMIAIRGLRMPNVSLRVRKDMPQFLWDTYLENMSKGYGQPAIVNEDLFLDGLVNQYDVPFDDAINYVFGGCSEVLIQGKTMCDSTWVAYNMLDIFEHTMYNNLLECDTFEKFYDRVKIDIQVTLKDMMNQINLRQHADGVHNPYPVRTLMTGDCIEKAKSFSNGGTKYNFDSTNVYGTTNTINALYTVKKLYEGAFGDVSKETFLKSFIANYNGYDELYIQYKNVPKFGNYNQDINQITKDIMTLTFDEIKQTNCYREQGRFMPAIILWVTWMTGGLKIGATPDGRLCSEPLADSGGPMQGTDIEGPTSTMGATLAIPQKDCVGTCVLNLRLDARNFETQTNRMKVQQLFQSYFAQGGCQLQVNVVDAVTLRDAMEHPENHRDLIVRVGGFSDNFVMLDPKIKEQILLRTEFDL